MNENLAHLAFKSENTLGRALPPEEDRDSSLYWMDPFGLDLIKIEYSKALRRLRGKTQVISGQKNIHIRDRLIHSMEVSAIATQIGLKLGLNISLIQASALGHDLGHVVYGHLGEKFIAKKLDEDFRHERFVTFVLEMIERDGEGVNLSYETHHAIRNHSRGSGRMFNGGIVQEDDDLMNSDKLSYIFSDPNDIMRINLPGLIFPDELMKLGNNQTERLFNCARALCLESIEKNTISFEDSDEAKYFQVVRDFMYEEVYHKIERGWLVKILEDVYAFLLRYFNDDSRSAALALALMSEDGVNIIGEMVASKESVSGKKVSNFSDKYVKEKIEDTSLFAIAEFLPRIPKWSKLDFCNPDRFLDKNNFGKVPKLELFSR